MADPLTSTLVRPAPPGTATPPLRVSLAVLALILMPFPIVIHGWGDPKAAYDYVTVLFPVDLALAGLIVAGIGPLLGRIRRGTVGLGAGLFTALTLVMTAAWFFHPSARGLHTTMELWGVAVLADTLAEAAINGFGALLVGTVAFVAVLEAAWSAVQQITRSGLGLTQLGEDPHPFYPFSHAVWAPMGSMVHPYVLAGLALVGGGAAAWWGVTTGRRRWLVVAAVAVAPVGFTFSRAGLLSLGLLAAGFAVGALRPGVRRGPSALAAVLLCAGFAVPAAVWSSGWVFRANQTTSATTADALTTDRGALLRQGLDTIAAEPLTGVGPGRYVIALRARTAARRQSIHGVFKPVHNVVLLVGGEGGVVALLVMAALYLGVGWRSFRAGPLAFGVYLAYIPFSMLDHFPYSFPQGLVITGVWLAVLDWLWWVRREPTPAGQSQTVRP
jgi:O-antigen ligase